MTSYTVQCAAVTYSTITVTVEADDLETALAEAIGKAEKDDGWEVCEVLSPAFVQAVAQGEDVELWALDFDQQLPVPDRFTEHGIRR
jgi:hypothetical protein